MTELSFTSAGEIGLQVAFWGLVLCSVSLLVARAFQKASEPFRYAIHLAGLIGILATPGLVFVGKAFPIPWHSQESVPADVVRIPYERMDEVLNPPVEPANVAPERTFEWEAMVTWCLLSVWGGGTFFCLAKLALASVRSQRWVHHRRWKAEFWTPELQARLAASVGLRRFPPVFASPTIPMPMVRGLFRPVIVVPEAAPAGWGKAQWEAILLHEAAHIARNDLWVLLAQRLAVAFYWWSPLMHLVSQKLHELRENICDDYALQGPCDHLAYAEILVESAECMVRLKPIPVTLGLLESARGGLEGRIARLLQKEKRPMVKVSFSGRLLAVGLLGIFSLGTTAATAFSGSPPANTKNVQIKIVVDGKEIDLADPELWKAIAEVQKQQKGNDQELVIRSLTKANVPAPKPQTSAVVPAPVDPPIRYRVVLEKDEKNPKVWAYAAPASEALGRALPVDSRIEALVKEAEAIQPGSGAEIRKLLQQKEAAGIWMDLAKPVIAAGKPVPLPAGSGLPARVEVAAKDHVIVSGKTPAVSLVKVEQGVGGKQIIILEVDPSTAHAIVPLDVVKPAAPPMDTNAALRMAEYWRALAELRAKAVEVPKQTEKKNLNHVPNLPKIIDRPKEPTPPPSSTAEPRSKGDLSVLVVPAAPAPPSALGLSRGTTPELETLQKNLDRLTRELDDLRKRLDVKSLAK